MILQEFGFVDLVCCTSLPHNGWFDEVVLLLWFVVSPFHNGLLVGGVAWLTWFRLV
jgi:hypothetical protein